MEPLDIWKLSWFKLGRRNDVTNEFGLFKVLRLRNKRKCVDRCGLNGRPIYTVQYRYVRRFHRGMLDEENIDNKKNYIIVNKSLHNSAIVHWICLFWIVIKLFVLQVTLNKLVALSGVLQVGHGWYVNWYHIDYSRNGLDWSHALRGFDTPNLVITFRNTFHNIFFHDNGS